MYIFYGDQCLQCYTRLKVPKHLNQKTVVLPSVARTNDLMVPRIVAVVEDGSIPATYLSRHKY